MIFNSTDWFYILQFALRALPENSEFLRSLAINPVDATETLFEHHVISFCFIYFILILSFLLFKVFNEMLEHASDMSSVLQKITLFYTKHGLESANIIT